LNVLLVLRWLLVVDRCRRRVGILVLIISTLLDVDRSRYWLCRFNNCSSGRNYHGRSCNGRNFHGTGGF
jgi:hypothetical protein